MRCEEVQTELARDAVTPHLRDAVASHLAGCAHCTHVRVLFGQVEVALQRGPLWNPPEGFARRTALRASWLGVSEPFHIGWLLSPSVLRAATLGVFVATGASLAAYVLAAHAPAAASFVSNLTETARDAYTRLLGLGAAALVANSTLLTWACAGVSLWVATRFTRRPLM